MVSQMTVDINVDYTKNTLNRNDIIEDVHIGHLLRDSIQDACKQDRITCGLSNACQILETSPDSVLMCILPRDSGDVMSSTLIEAFCWEMDVNLIKIDSSETLADILTAMDVNTPDDDDLECLVIQRASPVPVSPIDRQLIAFCEQTCNMSPSPIVELAAA